MLVLQQLNVKCPLNNEQNVYIFYYLYELLYSCKKTTRLNANKDLHIIHHIITKFIMFQSIPLTNILTLINVANKSTTPYLKNTIVQCFQFYKTTRPNPHIPTLPNTPIYPLLKHCPMFHHCQIL